jgi:hypothetical protein
LAAGLVGGCHCVGDAGLQSGAVRFRL